MRSRGPYVFPQYRDGFEGNSRKALKSFCKYSIETLKGYTVQKISNAWMAPEEDANFSL